MAWERWGQLSEGAREQVAPLATNAAITIGAWGRAAHYTQAFAPADHEGGFYCALLALHEGNYATALDEVAKSRSLLAANLVPLTTEGYQRTYPVRLPLPILIFLFHHQIVPVMFCRSFHW